MVFVFSFVLIFKTGDNEASLVKKMPCEGWGGCFVEVCSLVGREVKPVTEVKRVHKQSTNKQKKKKSRWQTRNTHNKENVQIQTRKYKCPISNKYARVSKTQHVFSLPWDRLFQIIMATGICRTSFGLTYFFPIHWRSVRAVTHTHVDSNSAHP